ncbi:MAG: universal stress protein [Cytophagales bacterium]
MKKIIVPIDFSDCSLNAVRYAITFARLINAELMVLYVHVPEVTISTTPVWQPYFDIMPLPIMVHEQMKEVEKIIKQHGIKVKTFIQEGALTDVITQIAKSKHADLVIMGTQGVNFSYNSIWGSNTSDLIEERNIPVLVIPENYNGELQSGAEIVFATDFKSTDFIPDYFIELSKNINAIVNVFYVTEPYRDEEALAYEKNEFEFVESLFEGTKVMLHHSYKENLIHAVEEFASKKHASMILMIGHQRGFLGNLLHSSVTKRMALHTRVPFFAIPDEKVEMNKTYSW